MGHICDRCHVQGLRDPVRNGLLVRNQDNNPMNLFAHRSRLWLVVIGRLLLLALPLPALAHGPSSGGAQRTEINGLFTIVFWIALPIFLLVEGLILFAILRYRRRSRSEMPDQVEGNTALELTWTILSFVIIAVVFILTYRFMTTKYEAEAQNETGIPDLMVHVEGYMFNWDYEYFLGEGQETGVKTTRQLSVPANRLILLEITSRDVQHSFWVPELAGKVDAVPGYVNTMWLTVPEPGVYKGNCAEFCGTLHWDMIIELVALPPDEFDMWLAEREAAAGRFVAIGTDLTSPLPAGDAARGEAIFTEQGCGACHGASAGAGPALSQMIEDAAAKSPDAPQDYLRESILLPCAVQAEGYNCAIMPANYGEKLDAQGLADLIEYLLQQ